MVVFVVCYCCGFDILFTDAMPILSVSILTTK